MMILGIKYDNVSVSSAVKNALDLLKSNKKTTILFLNADCLYKAQRDEQYRNILNSSNLGLPDGIGLLRFATGRSIQQ